MTWQQVAAWTWWVVRDWLWAEATGDKMLPLMDAIVGKYLSSTLKGFTGAQREVCVRGNRQTGICSTQR